MDEQHPKHIENVDDNKQQADDEKKENEQLKKQQKELFIYENDKIYIQSETLNENETVIIARYNDKESKINLKDDECWQPITIYKQKLQKIFVTEFGLNDYNKNDYDWELFDIENPKRKLCSFQCHIMANQKVILIVETPVTVLCTDMKNDWSKAAKFLCYPSQTLCWMAVRLSRKYKTVTSGIGLWYYQGDKRGEIKLNTKLIDAMYEKDNYGAYKKDKNEFKIPDIFSLKVEDKSETVPKEGNIKVKFKTLTGMEHELKVHSKWLVSDIKPRLQDVGGFPCETQVFIFNGRNLDNGACLDDYGIKDGDTITFMLDMKGS